MRSGIVEYGSEFGLGISLFSLAVSIRAETIIEIGRWKGFSGLALAGALRFLDWGWTEPDQHKQRTHEVDYDALHARKTRRLYSIDPYPRTEAQTLLRRNGLLEYVEFVDAASAEAELHVVADLLFIDGDHTYQGCRADVDRYVTRHLRAGGYFVLHDYYGWYDESMTNRSPIKKVCDELIAEGRYEHLLVDTHYQSFMVFRKT